MDDSGQVRDETTMEYVLRTFLRVEGDMERHPLPLALANDGIDDMATLVMLDKNHIAALRWKCEPPDGSGNKRGSMKELSMAHQLILRAFTKFANFLRVETGGYISNNKWFTITVEQFVEWRSRPIDVIDNEIVTISMPTTTTRNTHTKHKGTPVATPRTASNPAADFTKSIKRDKTHYTELKDEKHWDKWMTGFVIQATAHGVDDILNHEYKPSTDDEKAVFREKQKFMMSVFHHCLKTDQGKDIVREHLVTGDAQKVYADLCHHMSKSTGARITAGQTLAYLVNASFDPKTWTHGAKSFILHWTNQARVYNEMVANERRLHPSVLVTFLQKAVKNVDDLRAVATTAEVASGGSGTTISNDFERYKKYLLSAAADYDDVHAPRKSQPGTRLINLTDFDYEDNDYDSGFTYDTAVQDIIEVNMAKGKYGRPTYRPRGRSQPSSNSMYLPTELFSTFTDAQKGLWIEFKNSLRQKGSDSDGTRREVNFCDEFQDAQQDADDDQPNEQGIDSSDNPGTDAEANSTTDNTLLAYVAGRQDLEPSDIRRIMSTSVTRKAHITEYTVSKHQRKPRKGQLVDRGASGGVAADDLRILCHTSQPPVSVIGLDNHEISNLPIVNAVGITDSQHGPIILHFNQYAYVGRGKSIHSCGQIEHYKNQVDEKSRVVGGQQVIRTLDGYIIPVQIRQGLPEMDLRPPTDEEMERYPHVVMTADEQWNPSVLDFEIDLSDDTWYDTLQGDTGDFNEPRFDAMGNYQFRNVHNYSIFDESEEADQYYDYAVQVCHVCSSAGHTYDDCPFGISEHCYVAHETRVQPSLDTEASSPFTQHTSTVDYAKFVPNFAWMPIESIKKTFHATTQYAKYTIGGTFRRHFKTRFPALNTPRRNEPVATDYLDVGIAAVDDGSTGAQVFVGTDSRVIDVHGVKSDAEFVATLEDEIRHRGAMDLLISDSAKSETSKKVKDILRAYRIHDFQSEPHHQNQNPAERHIQRLKEGTNRVLDRSGAPAHTWLLAMAYVAFLLNHMALESLDGRSPLEVLLGMTPDISAFLVFYFYQPVYYAVHTNISFPEEPKERLGYWVGIAENVGDGMCWKILDKDTEKIVHRSDVRPADDPLHPNIRLEPEKGEHVPPKKIVRDRRDVLEDKWLSDPTSIATPVFEVDDLIGRTFLMEPDAETNERYRGKIKRVITTHGDPKPDNIANLEFLVEVDGSSTDELLSYNEILDYINKQTEEPTDLSNPDAKYTFNEILGHEGPLHPSDKRYKGSIYNVLMSWNTGERTMEPLSVIGADDPVTCAIYAQKNNLLEKRGWKKFKRIVKREKVFKRLINQTRIKQFRRAPKYKFGVQIPYDYKEAMRFDAENGNDKWKQATNLEVTLLDSFGVFKTGSKARYKGRKLTNAPDGYQHIRSRMIYDCKHDGRHRARYVAGGHLTDIPLDSCYSGVVAMEDVRMIVFLAELNQLELWGADISSAYLLADTKEKVFFVAGPEFGEREGHIMYIMKAQYGLRTSGVRWHEKLFDVLKDIGFTPSLVPDIYMRRNTKPDGTEIWEYVATYVDDLLIAMLNPQELIDALGDDPFNFECKGVGPLTYHLGSNFERDDDGTLRWVPRKYIDRMLDTYNRLFDNEPLKSKKFCSSPLEHGDHPEIDDSTLLDPDMTAKYQSLIGSFQWLITLGRFDIHTATMTMSRFSAAPRQGHLERLKRIASYIKHTREYGIRVRTNEPDYSDVPSVEHDWSHTVYTGAHEQVPHNAPTPLGKPVVLTSFVDANLEHCKLTGRAVTGVIEMMNGTPIGWYSKRQSTVETATYGSEIVAARIACDRTIDKRTRLRYLGVPIKSATYLFGDNRAVVDMKFPHSKLAKRHHSLNWHRTRECIAAKILIFNHIDGKHNPADILSKHCGYSDGIAHIKPLFDWAGDTAFCFWKKSSD